jgi:hypothetical protein
LVERPGLGVDRTLIRDRLRLTPGQRARLAVREWERTRAFDLAVRGFGVRLDDVVGRVVSR